eukprot:gene34960-45244_t
MESNNSEMARALKYLFTFSKRRFRAYKPTLVNLHGERSPVNTGVWIGQNKVSAVGVTASRWITMHGISLNVSCDIAPYERIVPCGIAVEGRYVCNMVQQQQFKRPPPLGTEGIIITEMNHSSSGATNSSGGDNDKLIKDVAERWTQSFARVFDLAIQYPENPAQELDLLVNSNARIRELTLEEIS